MTGATEPPAELVHWV